jgi:PmbA protein
MTYRAQGADLITPVERAAGILSQGGLDFYEVFASYSRSIRITIRGKGIKDTGSSVDLGIGIRAYKNKGLGTAYSQSLDPSDVERAANTAMAYARVAQPDPFFKAIPGPSKAPDVRNLFDRKVADLVMKDVGELAREMIGAADDVRPGAMYEGGVNAGRARSHLMTSTGVSVEDERTILSGNIAATYRQGEDTGSSSEFDYGVSLAEVDLNWVGKRATEKAVEQFGSKRVESASLPVILTPESASSVFFGLIAAISGEQVVKARTFASTLLGKQIAPDWLEVYDDGTLPGAVGSATYDGEGVPTRRMSIVGAGNLRAFLHNSYSAGIEGVETNGHAQRGGYGVYVGAGPTNVVVKAGESSLGEMIAETKKGILAIGTDFTPSTVTGEFSSTIDEGFLIENGEKKHPVKNLMAGGHILDLCRNTDMMSREGRTFGKGHFFPSLRISAIRFSGD